MSVSYLLGVLLINIFTQLPQGRGDFKMREILEKAKSVSYSMWINATGVPIFACYEAGCYFKAISHMQLYLRVKFFITILR